MGQARQTGGSTAAGTTPEPTAFAVPWSWKAYANVNANLAVKISRTCFYLADITEPEYSARNYFGQQLLHLEILHSAV
jgi:hypothetical protein